MGTTETKLNRLAQTKVDIKNAIINKGVEIDDTTPFKDYAAKIEEIKGSSSGGSIEGLNIFCQTEEPEVKDGIWIQGDKTFDSVKVTDIVSNDPYWASTNSSALPYAVNSYRSTRVQKGADVYILDYATSGFRYNVVTGESEKITYPSDCTVNMACTYNDDIYLFGYNSTNAFKYNTITKEFTQLATAMPRTVTETLEAVLVGEYIYLLGGAWGNTSNNTYGCAYKYSIANDTYTKLSNTPLKSIMGGWACKKVGDKIYIFGSYSGSNTMYEYDIASDSYTKKAALGYPIKNAQTLACVIGTDIYYFGTHDSSTTYATKAYKYDTTTDTHTQLPDIPHNFYYGYSGAAVAYYDNKVYLMSGGVGKRLTIMEFPKVEFNDNSVVIQSGDIYKTHFMTPPSIVEGGLETPFKDAFHYTDANGLNGTLPTYYGDGTKWNKFKN